MRPTLLQFRSSKEKTPWPYELKSTYDGRSLNFKSPKGDSKRRTFSCEKRFVAYDILARRTGYRVGPGSYSPELYKPKIRSGSPYREPHGQKNIANNGYFMVGDSMEFDPLLMLNSKKKFQNDKSIKLDSTYYNNQFIKSNATTNHSVDIEHSPYMEKNLGRRLKFEKNKNKNHKMQDLITKRFRKSLS